MKRIGLLIIAIGFQLSTLACRCKQLSPSEALSLSQTAFTGKVLKVVMDKEKENYSVTFKVLKTFKGELSEEVVITTKVSSAACGYNFEKGTSYLVFAADNSTNSCSGTMTLADFVTNYGAEVFKEKKAPTVVTMDQLITNKSGQYLYDGAPFTGTMVMLYDNGNIMSSRPFINGFPPEDYQSMSYYKDGKLSSRTNFKEGKLITTEGFFPEDNPNGYYRSSYDQATLTQTSYYFGGKVAEVSVQKTDTVTYQATFDVTTYYPTGQLKEKYHAVGFTHNKHGDYIKYHPNGKVAEESKFNDGVTIDKKIYNEKGKKIKLDFNYEKYDYIVH